MCSWTSEFLNSLLYVFMRWKMIWFLLRSSGLVTDDGMEISFVFVSCSSIIWEIEFRSSGVGFCVKLVCFQSVRCDTAGYCSGKLEVINQHFHHDTYYNADMFYSQYFKERNLPHPWWDGSIYFHASTNALKRDQHLFSICLTQPCFNASL